MSDKLQLFKQTITLPELLGITGEAEEQRDKLATAAIAVKTVTNTDEQLAAVVACRDIHTLIKQTKEAGLDFRRPINDFVSQVKAAEDEYLNPLIAEQSRVEKLQTSFAIAEQRRVEVEERAKREALAKAEAERIAAEQKAAQAAAKATTEKQLDKAIVLEQKAVVAEQAVQSIASAVVVPVSKVKGSSLKMVMKWECTDVAKLYASNPTLVSIEPKPAAIKACCKPKEGATQEQPDTSVPGLRMWYEADTTTRSW